MEFERDLLAPADRTVTEAPRTLPACCSVAPDDPAAAAVTDDGEVVLPAPLSALPIGRDLYRISSSSPSFRALQQYTHACVN